MLFEIPLSRREIKTTRFPTKSVCLHIDEVGVFVLFDSNTPALTTDYLRCCIMLRESTHAYIEAKDVRAAIEEFYKWDEAQTGGSAREAKALWIDHEKPIFQLPPCERLHKNRRDEYTCGRPIHSIEEHKEKDDDMWNNNGENGMCVLEGYDKPDGDCPIGDFYSNLNYETVVDRGASGGYCHKEQTLFIIKPCKKE